MSVYCWVGKFIDPNRREIGAVETTIFFPNELAYLSKEQHLKCWAWIQRLCLGIQSMIEVL